MTVFRRLLPALLAFVLLLSACGQAPAETQPPETEAVTLPTATFPPVTEPTEPPFDQEANTFLLTFVGDCTLGSDVRFYNTANSFLDRVGEDYGYPFRKVASFFEGDDLTLANLEGPLLDKGYSSKKGFAFHGPEAYAQILTSGSVEAVTLANNHTLDFGQKGYESTCNALTEAGVSFVEKDKTALITTPRGLKVGLLAASFVVKLDRIEEQVQQLRAEGAELIIMAIHWGVEGAYRPFNDQRKWAQGMIDCGVDIVYGSHSHVLQPIEEYNGGIIYYSLGNFCFGGNHWPKDLDSAILQQQILRDADGSIRLGELTRIPVCGSSSPPVNDFQPTPYPEDSVEFGRVLSKLDGSFTGPNLVVNYG